jgi:hypothetical protein
VGEGKAVEVATVGNKDCTTGRLRVAAMHRGSGNVLEEPNQV